MALSDLLKTLEAGGGGTHRGGPRLARPEAEPVRAERSAEAEAAARQALGAAEAELRGAARSKSARQA